MSATWSTLGRTAFDKVLVASPGERCSAAGRRRRGSQRNKEIGTRAIPNAGSDHCCFVHTPHFLSPPTPRGSPCPHPVADWTAGSPSLQICHCGPLHGEAAPTRLWGGGTVWWRVAPRPRLPVGPRQQDRSTDVAAGRTYWRGGANAAAGQINAFI